MQQFFTATDDAFAALERKATGTCVVFPDEPMPPGSYPARGRVGIEKTPGTGATHLFVQRGIRNRAARLSVQRWFNEGHLEFTSFADMRRWLQHELQPCYSAASMTAAELTDLDAVEQHAGPGTLGAYIDGEELFRALTARIRGQDAAMRTLANQMQRHLAKRLPARPSTLMAVGPTGVGKTASIEHAAMILGRHQITDARYGYLRLDMSEYQEAHRVSGLLGAPQGYVGYADSSQLIQTLRVNPRTIVLLDEIDKAHSDVLRALMNVIDAGRLTASTSANGAYTLDCRRSHFIFTSNLDAAGVIEEVNRKDALGDRDATDAICRNHLHAAGIAPELLGRINGFLVFRPLDPLARGEIVTLAIARVAEEYGVRVSHIDAAVVSSILRVAAGTGFGVRPDEHAIDDCLGFCFAEAAARGDSLVNVIANPHPHCVSSTHSTRPSPTQTT